MSVQLNLENTTALVTGGGQGVGQAISVSLAEAGSTVFVNDYVAERAELVASDIERAGGRAQSLPFDVSDYAAVAASVASVPGIDILVNNAGNAGPGGPDARSTSTGPSVSVTLGPFADSDPAEWTRYIAVNLYGVMNCSRAVLPHMVTSGFGRVITVVSDAGRIGEPRMAPYAAAKAGAAGFMRSIAREVGAVGVTANCVALATVDTLGLQDKADESPELAERIRRQLKRYMVPRLGQPADVAGLVTFLASPMAGWITGQTYPVNGGYAVSA